jgi:serine/threonine protein kinase
MPKRKTLRRKHTKRKRTRKGGVSLGDSVIYPGIPCEGKDPTTYATKLFPKRRLYAEDYDEAKLRQVSSILKQIDPDQQYFLYPEFCDTKQGPLTEGNIEDIKGPRESYEPGYYDTMKVDLNDYDSYNMRNGEISFAKKWKQYDKSQTQYLTDLTSDAKHLVEGLRKLHAADVLHGDIHTGNIVYMKDGKPRFIDFDDSILKTTLTEKESKREIKGLVSAIAGSLRSDLYTQFKASIL